MTASKLPWPVVVAAGINAGAVRYSAAADLARKTDQLRVLGRYGRATEADAEAVRQAAAAWERAR